MAHQGTAGQGLALFQSGAVGADIAAGTMRTKTYAEWAAIFAEHI